MHLISDSERPAGSFTIIASAVKATELRLFPLKLSKNTLPAWDGSRPVSGVKQSLSAVDSVTY